MFSYRLSVFKLFGFTVWIDWTWLFLAVLVVWTLATGYFPQVVPGADQSAYWWMGVAGLVGLAFSIIVHEFAHSLVARQYEMPIRGITLFVFGGIAEMEGEPTSAKGEFWMALAGPLASLALAVIFFLMAGVMVANGASEATMSLSPVGAVVAYLAFINGLLGVFNLLPAFPLDGGRILRSALWSWKGDLVWATRVAAASGTFFGFALIALGLISAISGNFIGGIWWFLLGMFLQMAAKASIQQQMVRSTLSGVPVARVMRKDAVTVSPEMPIKTFVEEYLYGYFFKSFPVAADDQLLGCVDVENVKRIPRAEWPIKTVQDVMQPCTDQNTISPEVDAAKALRKMQRTGKTQLLVVDQQKLVGVLALRDLMGLLNMRLELDETEQRASPVIVPAKSAVRS